MPARSACAFLFVLLLLPALPAAGDGLDDADERLFRVQMAMAEKGDSRAQYHLGEMHEQGLGTKQDVEEAFKWYARAAEQGDPLAKRKLTHRKEIFEEFKREQEAEQAEASALPPGPAEDKAGAGGSAAPSRPAVARADQARKQEQEKIRAAERSKRRAMVRAMILERMRNPVGGVFGD